MNDYTKISSDKANGKSIKIYSEICSSWGYTAKKKAIAEIAKLVSAKGYDVEFKCDLVPGGTGIFSIWVIQNDGTKKLIFSNKEKDQNKGAIIGDSPTKHQQEIIDKIVS